MSWDDIRALHRHHAPELAGASTAALLARLAELRSHDETGRFDRGGYEQMVAIKWECALRFGAGRGWRLSPSSFPLRCLRLGTAHAGRRAGLDRYEGIDAGRFFDHAFPYRAAGKAAAIVSHPYDWSDARTAAAQQLAAEHGLAVDVPGEPSWWNPPLTTLVVWTGRIARPTDPTDGSVQTYQRPGGDIFRPITSNSAA